MGESEERLVYIFLVAKMMPLQLDIEAIFENVVEPGKIGLAATVFDTFVHNAVAAAGKAHQA